jgi:midasin (ATPase involved in ribosome maturation)
LPLLALLQHPDLSIRYLAIELLTFSLGIGESPKSKWTQKYIGTPDDAIIAKWEQTTIDYGLLPLFESEKIHEAKKKIRDREYFQGPSGRKLTIADLGGYTTEICGVLIPRFQGNGNIPSNLVMTENTKINLRNIAKIIVEEKPILLQSLPGAGKSFLIDEIAKLFGRFHGEISNDTVN